ncbi:Hypothetical predicted protein, partial [Paramuricea clavata]
SLFKKDIGWDERLDEESSNTWKLLQQELREATPIKTPRCYFNGVISEDITTSLEGFCDSSVKAYAAVVYLRLETRDCVQLNIVASKTRVAPLTKQYIPRLELLSALILAGLITHIKEALEGYIDISSIRCWSDSELGMTVTNSFGTRNDCDGVGFGMTVTIFLFTGYVAKLDNPADIPSRGTSPVELSNSMWFGGPEWLNIYTDPSEQTSMNENEPPKEVIKKMKLKKSKKPSETSSFNTACEVGHIGEITDCKRFSSLNKPERTTAIVLKFIQMFKSKTDPTVKAKPLTDYVLQAEELWLKDIQFQLMSKAKTRKWEREFGLTLKEHFWLRWKNEYLLELRNARRQKTKRQKGNCIKFGDVVVIHEENNRETDRRNRKDGAIRGAVVRKLTDKGRKCTEIRRRPIQKLYPVELSEGDEEIVTVGDNTENASEKDDQKTELRRRPIREAARKAQARRQELIESGSLWTLTLLTFTYFSYETVKLTIVSHKSWSTEGV